MFVFFKNFVSKTIQYNEDGTYTIEEESKTINLCCLKISLGFKEKEEIGTSIIFDTIWYLNGEYRLDGTRKLNAAVTKIIL